MKLSKKAQKAIEAMNEIDKAVRQFQKAYDAVDKEEVAMVGGVVVGMYSPAGGLGKMGRIGPNLILNGLVARIGKDEEENPLARILGH